jgi:hypothetical protein
MTSPFRQLTVAEGTEFQFRLVDLMHRHFDGRSILEAGDYGAPPELGRPHTTAKVEAVFADFFGSDDAALVAGAGTGALRAALMASLEAGASVVVHSPPMYSTTRVTFRAMGLRTTRVDFNDVAARRTAFADNPAMVHLQHARSMLEDAFSPAEVIADAKRIAPESIVLVDDNYAAMQVPKIGVELGADLSAFSLFKLLGEPGVGLVVGRGDLVARIREDAYSGGSKIQGPVALATLKAVVQAPVMLAIQTEVVGEVVERLNAGEIPGIVRAEIGQHQERTVLAELDQPITERVLDCAGQFGATTYPVGSQSRHETNVMIYRLSRAMCEARPDLATRMLRISPFRSGPDTVMRVLGAAVAAARAES